MQSVKHDTQAADVLLCAKRELFRLQCYANATLGALEYMGTAYKWHCYVYFRKEGIEFENRARNVQICLYAILFHLFINVSQLICHLYRNPMFLMTY